MQRLGRRDPPVLEPVRPLLLEHLPADAVPADHPLEHDVERHSLPIQLPLLPLHPGLLVHVLPRHSTLNYPVFLSRRTLPKKEEMTLHASRLIN